MRVYLFELFKFYFVSAEVPSPDEVDSYIVLQECLEMRKRYVFKEAIAPWEKEIISDPSTPKPNPDPFSYTPEGKSDVSMCLILAFCGTTSQDYAVITFFDNLYLPFFFCTALF